MKLATLFLIAFMRLVALAQETKSPEPDDRGEFRAKAKQGRREALASLRTKAEGGDADAQFWLGVDYAYGEGVAKDPEVAVQWYRKAAEQGHTDAKFWLGVSYAAGEGVSKDLTKALKWFLQAAEQGGANAQYRLGVMYENGEGVVKDPKKAVQWYKKASENGDARAQCSLGVMYHNGVGVAKDSKEAVKWTRKAAEQGVSTAQINLGRSYSRGDGVAKDLGEAVKWFRKAAEQGDARAQLSVGFNYSEGEGVLKDEIEALAWFNISAISGDKTAVSLRGIFERRLGPQVVLVAQQRSKEILKQIEANKAHAEVSVGTNTPLQSKRGRNPKSSGSGSIVSSSGYVLTSAHVVADASNITVITAQGTKTAMLVRVDRPNDLAVLKLPVGTYPALPVAASRRIRLGQVVATIGFPNIGVQGFSPKLTRGEISSLNGIGDDPRSWQVSVPVQQGNSGGPLLDENGNLIGVVMAKLGVEAAKATGDLPQNVAYAVKSAYALPLLEPYFDSSVSEPTEPSGKPSFEDMVAKAQQSAVLILVY